MRVEIIAAMAATGVGLSGTAWVNYLQANSETRERIVKISTVAEVISEQLDDLTKQMKLDRQALQDLMVDTNARLRVLESQH